MTLATRSDAWKTGAMAGAAVFLFSWALGAPGFLASLLLGALTAVFAAQFLDWLFIEGTEDIAIANAEVGRAAALMPKTEGPTHREVTGYVKTHESAAALDAELAASGRHAVEEAQVHMDTASEAAMEWKARHKPATETVEDAAVPDEDDAPDADADTDGEGSYDALDERAPDGLTEPRDGQGDDLTVIEGIGPKLSERLHEWGVWHYDQIAAWGPAEIAYADNNVPRFKGRCTRDQWVAQAKIIVRDGKDAFLARPKKTDD